MTHLPSRRRNLRHRLLPPADIDFLFLTHAHIDHIGRVPDLIDAGFCGEITCTHGTKALKSIAN